MWPQTPKRIVEILAVITIWLRALFNDARYSLYIFKKKDFREPVCWNVQGSAAPVLLVHGLGGNQANWLASEEVIRRTLPEHPVIAITVDLHDGVPHENVPKSVLAMRWYSFRRVRSVAKDIACVVHWIEKLEKVYDQSPILIGHSYGGVLVMLAARKRDNAANHTLVFTTGMPFFGTPLLTGLQHMLSPGSSLLKSLALPCHVAGLHFVSGQDILVPVSYGHPDAIHINGFGHLSLPTSSIVWQQISDYIDKYS